MNKPYSAHLNFRLCCKLHRLRSCTTCTLPRLLRLRLAENRIAVSMLTFLLLFFILHSAAFALEDDQSKPLYLSADTVSIDNKAGKSMYTGNVVVNQGTTHVTAAKATVYTEPGKNTIKEAIAEGDKKVQAHYWTITDPKKPELHAYADMIKIFPQENKVYLIGHAKVNQGKDSYEAPEIQYDSKKKQVFSPKSTSGRTVIVIHPEKTKGKK